MKKMRDKPTIAEVARAANVAASTVSRVLNGGYASADVKARVEKITQRMGYIPSPAARNLKTGRSGIVGLVVETTQGSWFHDLLMGVEEELSDKRLSVALCSLALTGKYDSTAVEGWISERRVDGVIFVRATKQERPLVQLAEKVGLPVVFIAPDHTYRTGYTVRARNREAGHDVAEHLVELGHKNIAFAGGPHASLDTRDRLQGVRDGMNEHGLKLDDRHVSFGKSYRPASGIHYAEHWLSLSQREAPTAVVFGNDEMALGFMRTVQSHGLSIPDDVSLVGFDGTPEGALWWPGLTSSAQPARKMGRSACREIFARMEDKEQPEGATLELPMELVPRESSGPVPKSRRRGKRSKAV